MAEVERVNSERSYDVLVAGGGVAGVAAAVSAARQGARTLLVEIYGFLGGMATAGLVNPFMSSFTSTGQPLVGGFFSEICARMKDLGGVFGRAFDPEAMKYAAQEMILESGGELLLHTSISGARMKGSDIIGIEALTKNGMREIDARVVVDATGDGDVAAMAGAPVEMGGPDGLTQAMTLMFTVGGVEMRKCLEYALKHPDQMRFPKPSSTDAVQQLLKGAVGVAGFYREVDEAREKGEFPLPQEMVFFISMPTPGQVVVNTTHIGGVNGTDSWDLTKAEIECRRQAMALMSFFKKYVPGFENSYLLQTGPQIGVRETRRVIGEHVFNVDDVSEGRKYPDVIMRSAYPVDIHSPVGRGYVRKDDGKPGIGPPPGDWYEVPYRCLVPLTVEQLLVAGRCVSSTHEGQAAMRIMPNCMALGQAAGTAAALCVDQGVAPRALSVDLLRSALLRQGAII